MVIPCCFYSLSGTKYTFPNQVITSGKYKAYQEYIQGIISKCGFIMEIDWLRIPSTKNVVLVGRKRVNNLEGNYIYFFSKVIQKIFNSFIFCFLDDETKNQINQLILDAGSIIIRK